MNVPMVIKGRPSLALAWPLNFFFFFFGGGGSRVVPQVGPWLEGTMQLPLDSYDLRTPSLGGRDWK